MLFEDQYCHTASISVRTPAQTAFEYLADGLRQGEWTLGAIRRRKVGDALFVGTSMFDEREAYVRILPAPEHLLVTCWVGPAPEKLIPRIWIRVVPAEHLERPAETCVVTLVAWRPTGQSDDSWRLTRVTHEAEVFLIRGYLERRGAA
jgi:hypothetical protein